MRHLLILLILFTSGAMGKRYLSENTLGMKKFYISVFVMILAVTAAYSSQVISIAPLTGGLETAFSNPSEETKPIMIWQWMDGLVSKEGITADLEAYKAAGIGGVQQFMVGGPMQVAARDSTNAIGTDNWRRLSFPSSSTRKMPPLLPSGLLGPVVIRQENYCCNSH